MLTRCAFDYAIVRLVPRVEREEFVNVGAIVFCEARDYLAARVVLDAARVLALFPDVDLPLVHAHLAAIPRVCVGGRDAGPLGQLSTRERWRWLVSPRSTILQTSAPHSGMAASPDEALAHLVDRVVG